MHPYRESSTRDGDSMHYSYEKSPLLVRKDPLNGYCAREYDESPPLTCSGGMSRPKPAATCRYESPDGGWGWFVVLGAFVLQTLSIGVTYTFGILLAELMPIFHASESTLAWIGSIQAALLYLTGIIVGPLLERFGWKATASAGCILSAIGYGTSALANNFYLLYFTYGVLTGVGNGLMYTTSMVTVQHYFKSRRAMATGIAIAGSGCGPFLFGLILPQLLERIEWRWTLVVLAGINLAGVLTSLLFRPLPLLADAGKQPASLPDEEAGPSRRCCSVLSGIVDTDILCDPIFVILCVAVFFFSFGYHVPYVYTPVRAEKWCHINAERSAMLVSIMGIANVASRLVFGWVADHGVTMRFYLGASMLVSVGLISVLIFLFNTYVTLIIYSALFGTFSGCWVALYPCLLVDLMGIERIERSLGHCMAFCSGAFLVATPLSGWIINASGSYDVPFIVVGAADMIGGLIFLTIRVLRRRRPDYESLSHPRGSPERDFKQNLACSGSFS